MRYVFYHHLKQELFRKRARRKLVGRMVAESRSALLEYLFFHWQGFQSEVKMANNVAWDYLNRREKALAGRIFFVWSYLVAMRDEDMAEKYQKLDEEAVEHLTEQRRVWEAEVEALERELALYKSGFGKFAGRRTSVSSAALLHEIAAPPTEARSHPGFTNRPRRGVG